MQLCAHISSYFAIILLVVRGLFAYHDASKEEQDSYEDEGEAAVPKEAKEKTKRRGVRRRK